MNLREPTRFSGHGGSRLGFKALGFLGLLPQGLGLGGFGCRGCQSWSARDEASSSASDEVTAAAKCLLPKLCMESLSIR